MRPRPTLVVRVVAVCAALQGCADCREIDRIVARDSADANADADAKIDARALAPPARSVIDGGGDASAGATLARSPLPRGFLRGQLHAHTSESEDSATPPASVQAWYGARGYDFVVITDHNHVTDTPDGAVLTIPGVELTKNLRACDPPAPFGVACALHVNALFVTAPAAGGKVDPGDGAHVDRLSVYRGEVAQAKTLHGIAMLNHPNMFSGADTAIAEALVRDGMLLLEVANQAWDAKNEGDGERRSTEAMWDALLARGLRVFGTATDDAHHYADADAMRARDQRPFPGDLGFVVVHAAKNAQSIRGAIERGDFYASTGLVFETHVRSATSITLGVHGDAPIDYEVVARDGTVTRRERATKLEVKLRPDDGPYVRVRAKRDDGAIAFSQPIFRGAAK